MIKIKDIMYIPLNNDQIEHINKAIEKGYIFTGHTEVICDNDSTTFAVLILWEEEIDPDFFANNTICEDEVHKEIQ